MEPENQILPNLFRAEYSKILAVLCKRFGTLHIDELEDVVGETFAKAAETWPYYGIPSNAKAWLYTVSKNAAIDRLRKKKNVVSAESELQALEDLPQDGNELSAAESQLMMLFAICGSPIPEPFKIPFALNALCGFGVAEIAAAFGTTNEAIYKRLQRAKKAIREKYPRLEPALSARYLDKVLEILYLLFNEGYSSARTGTIRDEFCSESISLLEMLIADKAMATPESYSLMALMYYQASRFRAREAGGALMLYDLQDVTLWNQEYIAKGNKYIYLSFSKDMPGRYQLEASIAYWHTRPPAREKKWHYILELYDRLLCVAPSDNAVLSRIYALYKVTDAHTALQALAGAKVKKNHFYYTLSGILYESADPKKALGHFHKALQLSPNKNELLGYISRLSNKLTDAS